MAERGTDGRTRRVGLAIVVAWFAIGGLFHFTATDTLMRIVPPTIPWPLAAVLVSGVFEWLGAVGLLIERWRRAAGAGLFLLTIAVTPANVYMLLHPELFESIPYWALLARLPLQLGVLWLIGWSTGWYRWPQR